ncbi:hypothetical protein M405DRAFT_849841 [Rhizopogon salebrosus TDB-379]|nr:hypothetical protein M405DRAFT_849841 [Rhizopogon salebrosus TDB-379]
MPKETFKLTVRFEKRDSEDNIVLRVVVENDWASTYHVHTCTAKLPAYLESLDVLLLPQTIKDAIVSTHNLKLRYLWADSLCILQDSDEDKQREIPQMCDIYRDACVTIIAASSQKVSEGFLYDRKRPVETPLPFWCPDGRLGSISVDEDTSATPSNEPVNHRACDDVRALLAAWWDVLRDYTQRAVSDPSDRLVAISRIAQLFQRWWGSNNRYIAGLWERNLSTDLLWYRSRPSDGRLITGQYLAPSWSWAATIGRVAAGSDRKSMVGKIVWDVLLCEAIPVSDDHPLGQVKGGNLTVRTIVKDVTWDYEKAELMCQSSEVAVSSKVQERHIGYVYLDYDIENDQGVGTDKGKAVIIGSNNGENPGHLTGLIVVPAGSAGEFPRVGMFHVDGRFYEDDEAPYCEIRSWLNTPTEVITMV